MKIVSITAALITAASVASARDNVQIAGSSTVLPYAAIVAELFGENFDYPTPVVESGGSSAGLKRFCSGVGDTTVDIANSSRPIKDKEIATCVANGVTEITEVRLGYDGIVFATSLENKGFENLTQQDIFLALNATSTATHWDQVNPNLPHVAISVFIPGTKHGTREVFEDKVLDKGCNLADKNVCHEIRDDGVSVDIDGDYTETLARIPSNPNAIGVFGLSFLLNNTDKIYAANISGVEPSVETIASGTYPVSRPLFFYVKNAHIDVIPGLKDYVQFFMSDDIAGSDGPLAEYGLVADPEIADTQVKLDGL